MRSLYNTGPTGPQTTSQREYDQNIVDANQALAAAGITGDVQLLNPAVVEETVPYQRPIDAFGQGVVDFMRDDLGPGTALAAYYAARSIPFHPALYPVQRGIDIAEMAYINAYGKDFLGNEIDPMLANTLYGSLTALGASGTVLRGLRSNVALNSIKETMGRAFNPGGPVSRIPLGRSILDESYTVQGLRNIQEGMAPHVASLTSGLDRTAQQIDLAQDDLFNYLIGKRDYTDTPLGNFLSNRTSSQAVFPRRADRRIQNQIRGIEDQLDPILPAGPRARDLSQPSLAELNRIQGGSLKDMYQVMAPLLPSFRYKGVVPRGLRKFQEGVGRYDLYMYLPAQRQFARDALKLSATSPRIPFGRLGDTDAQAAIRQIIKANPTPPPATFGDHILNSANAQEAAVRQYLAQQGGPQTVVEAALLRALDTVDDPVQKRFLMDMYMNPGSMGATPNLPVQFRRFADDYAKLEDAGVQMPADVVNRAKRLLKGHPMADEIGSQLGEKARMSQGRKAFEEKEFGPDGLIDLERIAQYLDTKTPLFSRPQFFPMDPDLRRVNAMTEGANLIPINRAGDIGERVYFQPTRAAERYTAPYQGLRRPNPRNKTLLNLRDQQAETGQVLFPGQEGALLDDLKLPTVLRGGFGRVEDPGLLGQEMQYMTRGVLAEYDAARFPMITKALNSTLLDQSSQVYGLHATLGGRALETTVDGKYIHILDLIDTRSRTLAALNNQGFGSEVMLDSPTYLAQRFGGKAANRAEAEAILDAEISGLTRLSREESEALLLELDQAIAAHADGQPWLQEAIYYISREADDLYGYGAGLSGRTGYGVPGTEFVAADGERMMNIMQVALRNQFPDLMSPTATGQLKTATSEMLGLPGDALQLSALDDFWMNFHVSSGIRGLNAETKAWFRQSFDKAIAAQPRTTKPVTVYRSISANDDGPLKVSSGDIIDLKPIDDVGNSPGISSSLDPNSAMGFSENTGGTQVLYEIQLPAGSQVYDPSQVMGIPHRKETELILPNATQYRVQRVEPIYRQGGAGYPDQTTVDEFGVNGIKVIIKPITSFRDGGRYRVKKRPGSMRCKK